MAPVGFFNHIYRDDTPNCPTSILAHLDQLEPWESSLFPHVQGMCPPHFLRNFLLESTSESLYICHDGGACENGSFGWTIASTDQLFWEGSVEPLADAIQAPLELKATVCLRHSAS